MKKRRLFTIGVLALGLTFTACNDDEDETPDPVLGPSMDVVELMIPGASTGGDLTIELGDELQFAWDVRKGLGDMEIFDVSVISNNLELPVPTSAEGNDFPYMLDGDDEDIYLDTLSFPLAGLNVGETVYTFTVSDENGASTSVSYNVIVEETSTPLISDDFIWERINGEDGTGLDQFGLEWTDNSTTSAIVAMDEATIFVELTAQDWTDIMSVEELSEAILAAENSGATITEYTGVSVQQSGDYTDYLGVFYDDEFYILNVQSGTVDPNSGGGFDFTIEGQYKN